MLLIRLSINSRLLVTFGFFYCRGELTAPKFPHSVQGSTVVSMSVLGQVSKVEAGLKVLSVPE